MPLFYEVPQALLPHLPCPSIATPSHIPPEPLTTIGATARLMWEEFNAKSEI